MIEVNIFYVRMKRNEEKYTQLDKLIDKGGMATLLSSNHTDEIRKEQSFHSESKYLDAS